MSRPPKPVPTDDELAYMQKARRDGLSFVLIAHAISSRRGAYRAVGKERRDREVSWMWVQRQLHKTNPTQNAAMHEAATLHKTRQELEVRSSEPQAEIQEGLETREATPGERIADEQVNRPEGPETRRAEPVSAEENVAWAETLEATDGN